MKLSATLALVLVAATAYAQPTITNVSGSVSHGSVVTVSGNAFGTKTVAAPKVWDRAEGTSLGSLWDDWQPTTAGDPSCNMAYRGILRNVALPYVANNSRYLAACHYGVNTSTGGNMVQISHRRTAGSYPNYSYWSFYWRMDPNWSNSGGENTDGNNKIYGIGDEEGVLAGRYWYAEYGSRPISPSASASLDVYDSGGLGYRCRTAHVGSCHSSGSGQIGYGPQSNNPINGWIKTEIMIRWDRTSAGYVLITENGQPKYHTTGETDTVTSSSQRFEGIGMYSRARGINNFRYFDDVYFDTGADAIAHAELCPGSTFNNRGVCQTQPAVSWSNSSVALTVNRGGLPASGTAYLYVTDRNRATNANGFAVTLGGGTPSLTTPQNLRVVPDAFAFASMLGAFAAATMLIRRSNA
jgi:hypothetical protein